MLKTRPNRTRITRRGYEFMGTIVELECPWCKRKRKETEHLGLESLSLSRLCFERGKNGDNVSDCAILHERHENEELMFKKLCIPSEMWSYKLNFHRADIHDYALELINSSPKMVLITGATPGTGKTGLAVSMLMGFARRIPQSTKFKPFYLIMSEIKRAIERDTDSTVEETIKKYSDIGMLCIDDIGAEQTTEYQIGILYQILNNRIENGKITIVTTNLSGEELARRFGARIQDRLGSDKVIRITSKKSHRADKAVVRSFDV